MLLPDIETISTPKFNTVTGLDGLVKVLFLLYKLYEPFLGIYDEPLSSFQNRLQNKNKEDNYTTYYTLDNKLIGFLSTNPMRIGRQGISGSIVLTIPDMRGYGVDMYKHNKATKRITGFMWKADSSNYPSLKLMVNLGGVILGQNTQYDLQSNGSMTEMMTDTTGVCLVDTAKILKEEFGLTTKEYSSLKKPTEMFLERSVKPKYMKWLKNEYSKRGDIISKITKELTERGIN